ncbi:MAG TPA: glycosyltransferase [Vicinamibacterales bacterium]
MSAPIRLTIVLTHPVQYYAPWFRHIHKCCADLALTVIYATQPSAAQQGTGFGQDVQWDVPLLAGYESRVLRTASSSTHVGADRLFGADAPQIDQALLDSRPDVVLVMGWHSTTYFRAMRTARREGIPLMVRGDTNLLSAPRGWKRPLWSARTRWLLKRFDACLSVGLRTGAFYRYFGVPDRQVFDTPHCVDNDLFAQSSLDRARCRARFGLSPSAFVPLFVGKLEDKKRPEDLIRAAAALTGAPEILLAGAGPLDARCRSLAAELGVRLVPLGFVNQSEMPAAYAAADCLVLPSDRRETWGLVVNEALSAGLPAVVTDEAGCAPDLIAPATGIIVRTGNIEEMSAALGGIRDRLAAGHNFKPACQAQAARYSFSRATEGLAEACRHVTRERRGEHESAAAEPASRVLACCGSMVLVGGLERMTFEVLGVLRQRAVPVHCIVNYWGNVHIVPLADRIGASWSTGFYLYRFARRSRRPLDWLRFGADIALTSAGLVRDSARFRPTHIFVSDYVTAVRNAPALFLLRLLGKRVVMRLGNAPDQGTFYHWLWKLGVNPFVDFFVCNSEFTSRELGTHGVPPTKRKVVAHTPPTRGSAAPPNIDRDSGRIIYVGQIIPEKGLDLLLDAMGMLVQRGHDVRLDVVGEMTGWVPPEHEAYRQRVSARASASDLRGRVSFLGFRDDIPTLMARAAIHCIPSRREQREAFGIVVIEAKQAGIPTVALASGALPELISQGEDGWVCEAETAASLAEGLEYFLQPDRLQRGMAFARASAANYGRGRFEQAWRGIFASA